MVEGWTDKYELFVQRATQAHFASGPGVEWGEAMFQLKIRRSGERRCGRGRGGSSKSCRRRSMPSFARARWPATQPRSPYVSTSLKDLHFSNQDREGKRCAGL